MRRFCERVAVALSMTVLAGCQTDSLFEKKAPEGPITRIDEAPPGMDMPNIKVADAHESDLVENVLYHRAMYARSLKVLHDYYHDRGYEEKRLWAKQEMADLARVRPYKYILAAEVPARNLRPTESVAAADRLYEEALDLMKKGGHGVPVFYRSDYMKQALAKFKQLIEQYPSSDKIDDAAFYCGEIHKEYMQGEDEIAVRWYEKALEWNPLTPHPVRFQTAVAYDYRLHDRDQALEYYQRVLKEETFNKSNAHFATVRIRQLTGTPESTSNSAGLLEPTPRMESSIEEARPVPSPG